MNHIENYWKTKTIASNNSFNQGHFEEALFGYKGALYRAEVLNNHIENCLRMNISFIQVYIISCNNIANTYLELNRKGKSENMLKRVIYYLLHLSANKNIKSDEIQNELKRATVAYVDFVKKNDFDKESQKNIFRSLKTHLIEDKVININ